MDIKDTSNPVGSVIADTNIENFLQVLAAKWDANNEAAPWWQFWNKISFTKVTNFLLSSLDELIAYVDDYVGDGADKKATVIAAVTRLYDYVVGSAMPIWLKPLSPILKSYIIDHIVSPAIDWIVDKYKNGEWRKKPSAVLASEWSTMKAQMFVPVTMVPNLPKV